MKGYRIAQMRYKTPVGEIDLIARKGKTIIFVEVKIRPSLDEALYAIHKKNRDRVTRAALYYLSDSAPPGAQESPDIRFDVFAIAPPFFWRHLDNAWQAAP
jgi:putative endonuclease